jgi:riboflavin synthase alpha subunit
MFTGIIEAMGPIAAIVNPWGYKGRHFNTLHKGSC